MTSTPPSIPPSVTASETAQIARANASGKPVVVFVHGLWLLAGSWRPWQDLFETNGYATIAPGWPDDPDTVAEGRENPERFAGKSVTAVTDHFAAIIRQLSRKPAIVGHSFGGVITQKLAGMGLASAAVAIDPAPFRGVLPLPLSALTAAFPVLGNPFNRSRAILLTFEQFRFAFANTVDEAEAKVLYDTWHVPAPGFPLFEAAFANVNPWTDLTVDTLNPARGPLQILSGERDNTVPWAITNAAFQRQKRNVGVTEIEEIPGRGHSLVIDSGWREVAAVALAFLGRNA